MRVRYTVLFSKLAQRQFDDLMRSDRTLGARIARAIDRLRENPFVAGVLKGPWKGYRKRRVGDYRIIYRIEQQKLVVYLITIAHRGEVYG